MRPLAAEAVALSPAHRLVYSIPVGPSGRIISASPLVDLPQAKYKSANFLERPFFELNFFTLALALRLATIENDAFDEVNIGGTERNFLNLVGIWRHVQLKLLAAP